MDDPQKEKFILKAVDKVKALRQRIEEARKNKENIPEIMEEVQKEIKEIKAEAETVFDSNKPKMTPEELEAYLQNPSNFSKEDWDLLKTIKAETEQCKREIVRSNEREAVGDLVGKNKKKKSLKKNQRPIRKSI